MVVPAQPKEVCGDIWKMMKGEGVIGERGVIFGRMVWRDIWDMLRMCVPERMLRGQNTRYSPNNSVLSKAIEEIPKIATALLESARKRPRANCKVAKVLTLSKHVSVLHCMGRVGISIRF